MSGPWFFIIGMAIGGLSMAVFYRPIIARLETELEMARKGGGKAAKEEESE